MKRFIDKVQALGQKAEALEQAIGSLPGKAAKIRQAITMTGGELQQIRGTVQSTLGDLQILTEDQILETMREINDHADTFKEAGYELTDLELDLGTPHRLSVHLQKSSQVPHGTLTSIHARMNRASIKSILANLLKAEETAANVELTDLQYVGLILHLGAIPQSRLCWSSQTTLHPEPTPAPAPKIPAPSPAPLANTPVESFFERRPTPLPALPSQQPAPLSTFSPPLPAPPAPASTPPPPTPRWSKESLDRFKKMPSGSKY